MSTEELKFCPCCDRVQIPVAQVVCKRCEDWLESQEELLEAGKKVKT